MEYKVERLGQTMAKINARVAKLAEKGWRIHTWTVLLHKDVPAAKKKGGTDELIEVSVLFEREASAAETVSEPEEQVSGS